MKKRKRKGNRQKSLSWIMGRVTVVLLLAFLLTGCSRERMDIRREIDRIYKEAGKVAEDKAAAYFPKNMG